MLTVDFRSEVFKLCKAIQKRAETNIVNDTYLRLFTCKSEEYVIPQYSMFHEAAKHGNNQFYGYLYANEHTDDYKTVLQGITPLPDKDIQIFARAHATIYALIKECVKELEISNPKIAKALDPYSKYRPITAPAGVPFLAEKVYEKAAEAFRESKLYKKLINSSINAFVEKLKPEDIHTMFMVFEKEIVECPLDVVPESIKPLEKCLVTKFEKIEEILLAETLMIFALQKSLENACSLLYTALIGDDLRVFNNDNIFNIDKNYSNSLRKIIQLSAIGIFLTGKSNTVGDIMLVDCDPSPEYHMHEFGVIQSYSASFNGEMGDTSKVTMMVVDDLLNPYHLLTNRIIDMDFPPLVREELEDSKDKNISVKKKISRNEKCPCGSGLKYKFCCGKNK